MPSHSRTARKGRGAAANPTGRYEALQRVETDDGWDNLEPPPPPLRTELQIDNSRTVLSYNDSPDVPFDRSINPYRGCEHGCVYCFARPTHARLGLSPGLDFESRLLYKPDAATQLRSEFAVASYRCRPLALGVNTDAYQPVERRLGITRQVLELLAECRHPVSIVTKSALIERDLDLLGDMAAEQLASVAISVTTLQPSLARRLEPRAPSPKRRLATIEALSAAGIPVSVMVAPLIPVLTDSETETILERARAAGATSAGYVLLRLPLEVSELFQDWLALHEPLQAERVMNRIRDCRDGRDYQSEFGTRMRGTGIYAELLHKRFELASKRLAYGPMPMLDATRFRPPPADPRQLSLF